MTLIYNPYSLPLSAIGVEAIVLAGLVWERSRGKRGVTPFILLMAALAVWSLAYAVELAVPDFATKVILVKLEFVGIIATPVAAFLFAADYTGVDRWLSQRSIIWLNVIPVISLLLVFTSELHPLFYSKMSLDESGSFPNFVGTYGVWFWVHSAYSYLLMLFALGMLVRALTRTPQLYRGQAASLLIGMLAPWVGNAIHLAKVSPFPNLDITPFSFALTGVALAWSLVRFRLLDIVPAARDMVIENLHDAVIVVDTEGRVVDLNPAARVTIGAAADGAIGKPLAEVIPDQQNLIEKFRDLSDVHTEISITTGDIPRYFDLSMSLLTERDGTARGRLIVVHEITDSKLIEKKLSEARDQALEASRMKSRILAVVSHDFRTPLGAILGYADMLIEGPAGPISPEQQKLVERIVANASQLNNLVNDLLDQSQIEAGKITMHFAPFAPEKLIHNVEGALNKKAADKGLKLVTVIEESTPNPITGDLSRVMQVITNLADNAIKYTSQGEVKITLSRVDNDQWGIMVSDTGPGISEETQSHIFEPFWQADDYEVREGRGVGLGLSIAKQLVLRMGGKIVVESEIGKGTTFKATLPIGPRRGGV